jgi:hypothetical protein
MSKGPRKPDHYPEGKGPVGSNGLRQLTREQIEQVANEAEARKDRIAETMRRRGGAR